MAANVPVIDLDQVEPPAAGEARRFRPARPVLALGVAVLVLATLGAGAPPASRLVPVMSAGGTAAAAFVLGADSLYTAAFGNNPDSEAAVRGHRLADGAPTWAAALPQNVQNLVVDDAAHVLMARSATGPEASFLDTASGAVLWRTEEANTSIVTMARGSVLSRTDTAATRSTLRLSDARTGSEIWRRTVDVTAALQDMGAGGWTRFAAIGATGAVTVLNYADGRVLAEGDLGVSLPVRSADPDAEDYADVRAIGDRLYVARRERGTAWVAAYSLVPVAPLWRTGAVPAGRIGDCGPVLCVGGGTTLTAVDPATGAVRWSSADVLFAFGVDATMLAAYDGREPTGLMLRDAATGRAGTGFGHAHYLDGVVLRSDAEIAGRTWVLVQEPADRSWHVAGSLDTAAPFGCEVGHGHLACPTSSGPTTVWKLPGA